MARRRVQVSMEQLEGREVPALLIGLTSTGSLVSFDSATPGTVTNTVAVTGLTPGDSLVAIDTRPANGALFALANTNRLYTINTTSGVATVVSATPFTPVLTGSGVGFDFNPTVDKLRIVSGSGQNLRVNADTGVTILEDTALTYDKTSYDSFFPGGTAPTPQITASAYTTDFDQVTNKNVTSLYGLDANLNLLVLQGGPDGDPSPNGGLLFIVDVVGFDPTENATFEIDPISDSAFVADGGKLYSLDLATGGSKTLGVFANGVTIVGLAAVPPAAGAGTLALNAATFTFSADRTPLAVTVTRTGGSTGAVTVDYTTSNGTAVGGTDFAPTNGTLTFAAGETSKTIFLSLPAGDAPAAPQRTFNLTLSNATGGAALGATATATVTIPAVVTNPTQIPTRLLAVGAGDGAAPRVLIYDATTGTKLGSFLAYEESFSGGVSVATGDVNGDGTADVIVGAGPRGGPRVRIFDGTTIASSNPTLLVDFFAYEDTFRGGVIVATGDIDGDGFDDVIVGSGVGGGPRVRVFSGDTITTGKQVLIRDFFAYESTFRGGVNVSSGNFNGDGFDDIIAGAGKGGGPRVRIFNGQSEAIIADYFAYGSDLRSGVSVAAGDLNGDNLTDVIAGAGLTGSPNVRTFSGSTDKNLGGFFAYDSALRGGVRITTADFGGDGTAEIVTGSGPGGPSTINYFDITGKTVNSFQAFDAGFTNGVFVG